MAVARPRLRHGEETDSPLLLLLRTSVKPFRPRASVCLCLVWSLLATPLIAGDVRAQHWERTLAQPFDRVADLHAAPDGTVWIAGQQSVAPARIFTARLSPHGAVLGGAYYASLSGADASLSSLAALPDGGWVMGGSIGWRPWLAVIGPGLGATRFDATLGEDGVVQRVAADAQGGVLAVGRNRAAGYERAIGARFTADGQRLWLREFSEASRRAAGEDLAPLPSGGMLLVASQAPDTFSAQDHLIVAHVDSAGSIWWRKRIVGRFWSPRVVRLASGEIAIAACERVASATDLRLVLLRLSEHGALLGAWRYQGFPSDIGAGVWPHVARIVELSDGALAVAMRQPFRPTGQAVQNRCSLVVLSAQGALLSQRLQVGQHEREPLGLALDSSGGLLHGSSVPGAVQLRRGDARGRLAGACDSSIEIALFASSFTPTVQATLPYSQAPTLASAEEHVWREPFGPLVSSLDCSVGASPGVAYCTSAITTHGCRPAIAGVGAASVGAASGYWLVAWNVESQRSGLFFYGLSGRTSVPWSNGSTASLCVKAPVQRMSAHSSAGLVGACDGKLAQDWLAFVAGGAVLGAPFGPGTAVQAQAWFRDPQAPSGTNLSDALEFTTAP